MVEGDLWVGLDCDAYLSSSFSPFSFCLCPFYVTSASGSSALFVVMVENSPSPFSSSVGL